MNPTLHVTNWSSVKLHGPGRKFTIMARPRTWERGEGTVIALAPIGAREQLMRLALDEREHGNATVAMEAYKVAMIADFERCVPMLRPMQLMAFGDGRGMGGGLSTEVADGDTLCCACAKGADCHRRWAAPFLVRAGWRVILDGEEMK